MDREKEQLAGSRDTNGCATVSEHPEDADRFDPSEVVAGCFDFRTRTRSFDLHQLGGGRLKKKFISLFHSSSDGSIKPSTSAASAPATPVKGQSPKPSPQRRRRLVRVVRDVEPDVYGENNPHVIHKYSESYLMSKQVARQRSLSESEPFGERPLPYEVTGHTILKKPTLEHSISGGTGGSCSSAGDGDFTPVNKHTSFHDEVIVFEYDKKGKVVEKTDSVVKHTVRLHDAVFDDVDSHDACQLFEDIAMNETIAALTKDISNLDVAASETAEVSF